MTGIALYITGDGAKAMALCPLTSLRGDPNWEQQCVLRFGRNCVGWYAADGLLVNALYPDDALAVIRDHFRETLAQKGVWLELRPDGTWWAFRHMMFQSPLSSKPSYISEYVAKGKTYNEALIAAVLATFGKGGAA